MRVPAREICALARERGILSLLDGAQAAGVVPIDVQALGCDFYTTNGHKWLCSPKGLGFCYGRKELLDRMEPGYVGAGSTTYDGAQLSAMKLVPGARRFEYGSRGHAHYAGLAAAIEYLEELGWDAIHAHQQHVATYLKAQIIYRGWPLHTPMAWERASALNVFSIPGIADVESLYQRLVNEHRIYVQRIGIFQALRVSTAYFTSHADVDRLLAVLDRHRAGELADELIAEPVDRQDKLGVVRVGLELLAQPGHMHIDGAGRDQRIVAPDVVEQHIARERDAAVLDEVAQQPELKRRELDRLPVAADLGAAEVYPHIAKLVELWRWGMAESQARAAAAPPGAPAARSSRTAWSGSRRRRASGRRPYRPPGRAL